MLPGETLVLVERQDMIIHPAALLRTSCEV